MDVSDVVCWVCVCVGFGEYLWLFFECGCFLFLFCSIANVRDKRFLETKYMTISKGFFDTFSKFFEVISVSEGFVL